VPTYVVDAPGGGGKIPLMPNYLLSESDHRVVLRNYEGYIASYEEPTTYQAHDASSCPACQARKSQGGQTGISGLLEGTARAIKPEGFDELHSRSDAPTGQLPASTDQIVPAPERLLQEVASLKPGSNGNGHRPTRSKKGARS